MPVIVQMILVISRCVRKFVNCLRLLSACLSLFAFLSFSLCVWKRQFVSLCICLFSSVNVSLFVCLSFSPIVCLSLSECQSVCLTLCLNRGLSFCLSVSLSLWMSICQKLMRWLLLNSLVVSRKQASSISTVCDTHCVRSVCTLTDEKQTICSCNCIFANYFHLHKPGVKVSHQRGSPLLARCILR